MKWTNARRTTSLVVATGVLALLATPALGVDDGAGAIQSRFASVRWRLQSSQLSAFPEHLAVTVQSTTAQELRVHLLWTPLVCDGELIRHDADVTPSLAEWVGRMPRVFVLSKDEWAASLYPVGFPHDPRDEVAPGARCTTKLDVLLYAPGQETEKVPISVPVEPGRAVRAIR